MDAYSMVRGGKLNLKGKKANSSKSGAIKRKAVGNEKVSSVAELDERKHGGWWLAGKRSECIGNIALEIGDMRYIRSLDDGNFELGQSHSAGEGPDPEEMLTAMKVAGTDKYSFKTGFGKFVGVTASKGVLIATADAMGPLEMWDLNLEDEKATLTSPKGVLAVLSDGSLGCISETDDSCYFKVRSCASRAIDPYASLPKEERGGVKQTEINYVKSFQAGWVAEKRLKLSASDKSSLQSARKEGAFHEALLDRREKIKSDKHCK